MTKKGICVLAGILITIVGIGMFMFGVSMFSYQGPPISAFISKAGEYSFFLWLPTLVLGLILLITGVAMKRRKDI